MSLVISNLWISFVNGKISTEEFLSSYDGVSGTLDISKGECRAIRSAIRDVINQRNRNEVFDRICVALISITSKLLVKRRFDQARILLSSILESEETLISSSYVARLQFLYAQAFHYLKIYEKSLKQYSQSLDLFDQIGDDEAKAHCYRYRSQVLSKLNEIDSSIGECLASVYLFDKCGKWLEKGKTLLEVADLYKRKKSFYDLARIIDEIGNTFALSGDRARLDRYIEYHAIVKDHIGLDDNHTRESFGATDKVSDLAWTAYRHVEKSATLAARFVYDESLDELEKAFRILHDQDEQYLNSLVKVQQIDVLSKMECYSDAIEKCDEVLMASSDGSEIRRVLLKKIGLFINTNRDCLPILQRLLETDLEYPAVSVEDISRQVIWAKIKAFDTSGQYIEGIHACYELISDTHVASNPIYLGLLQIDVAELIYRYSGDYKTALKYFEESKTNLFDRVCFLHGEAMWHLARGKVEQAKGAYATAITHFRKAKDLGEKSTLRRVVATAGRLEAQANERLGNFSIAAGQFDEAADNLKFLADQSMGSVRADIASLDAFRGLKFGGKSLDVFINHKAIHPRDFEYNAKIKKTYAEVLIHNKKYSEALYYIELALSDLEQAQDLAIESIFELNCYRGLCLSYLGSLDQRLQDIVQVNPEDTTVRQQWLFNYVEGLIDWNSNKSTSSKACFLKALDCLSKYRRMQSIPELRLAFLRDYADFFENLVLFAVEIEDIDFLFIVLSEAKGQTFTDLLDFSDQSSVSSNLSPDTEYGIRNELVDLIMNHQQGADAGESDSSLQSMLVNAERHYVQTIPNIHADNQYLSTSAFPSIIQVQDRLGSDQALADMFILSDRIIILWISKSTSFIKVLDTDVIKSDDIDKALIDVNDWVSLIEKPEFIQGKVANVKQNGFLRRWKLLSSVLADHIQNIHQKLGFCGIYVVPHGSLNRLSIQAMMVYMNQPQVDMFYLPCSTSLFLINGYKSIGETISLTVGAYTKTDLKYTQAEARKAIDIIGKENSVEIAGVNTPEDGFWGYWNQSTILLLTCHSETRRHSYASYLKFDDDCVFAKEIIRRRGQLDNTDLVILSSCESGVGDGRVPDESMGLMTSFLIAGSPLVLATLWKVNDLVSALMVQEVITNIVIEKKSPSASLDSAMRSIRSMKVAEIKRIYPESVQDLSGFDDNDVPFEHPVFWSPYVLVGR